MSRKRHIPEEIIGMLREAEVQLSRGQAVGEVCRGLDILEQSYHRWRREYGGMVMSQAHRLNELERNTARLCRAVLDLTFDKSIRNEALTVKH